MHSRKPIAQCVRRAGGLIVCLSLQHITGWTLC